MTVILCCVPKQKREDSSCCGFRSSKRVSTSITYKNKDVGLSNGSSHYWNGSGSKFFFYTIKNSWLCIYCKKVANACSGFEKFHFFKGINHSSHLFIFVRCKVCQNYKTSPNFHFVLRWWAGRPQKLPLFYVELSL